VKLHLAARVCLLALLSAPPSGAATHLVQILEPQQGNFVFSPAQLVIAEGDTVAWSNNSLMPHNVKADDGSFRCAVGCDQASGGNGVPTSGPWSFEITFGPGAPTFGPFTGPPTGGGGGGGYAHTPPPVVPRADRTIRYHCEFHGAANGIGMSGTIVVQAPGTGGGDDNGGGGGGAVPGTLRFTQAGFSRNENGGSAVARVERAGGDDGAVSIQWSTENGSAVAGSDYTAGNGTIHWQDGEAGEKTFAVALIDDGADEIDETVTLKLASPTGGAALGAPQQATLTIVDNDAVGVADCEDGATSLCLLDRFFVTVHWRRPNGEQGDGRASKLSDGAGGFEFFEEGNLELFIKMSGTACSLAPGHGLRSYWVFLAGLTNVEVVVTIVDTVAGVTKTYTNPLGNAFQSVQATSAAAGAFATCDS
jgi:plastocyanin